MSNSVGVSVQKLSAFNVTDSSSVDTSIHIKSQSVFSVPLAVNIVTTTKPISMTSLVSTGQFVHSTQSPAQMIVGHVQSVKTSSIM